MSALKRMEFRLQEFWAYREMFQALAHREIRGRYKGSFFGFFWSLLNPLLMMTIYSFVFSLVMRIQIPNYSLHLLSGLLPWTWFSTGLMNATGAIVANSNLIKKIFFPHEILVLVSIWTNLVNYLFSIPVLILFMVIQHVPLGLPLLAFPLLLVIQFALTLGLGLITATLNAYFRDVEQLLGIALMAWFYLTPILYPLSFIPERFKLFVLLNPLSGLIISYQRIFIEGLWPEPLHLLYPLILSILILSGGLLFFVSRKFDFAEVV